MNFQSLCLNLNEIAEKPHKKSSGVKCVQFSLIRNIGDARLSTCLLLACYECLKIRKIANTVTRIQRSSRFFLFRFDSLVFVSMCEWMVRSVLN